MTLNVSKSDPYFTNCDNIYRKNGLLIGKVVKQYKCIDCVYITNTIPGLDHHYKQFHQNCISSGVNHKNYGKNRNILVTKIDQSLDSNEFKTFEEINCGKRLKTYSKRKYFVNNSSSETQTPEEDNSLSSHAFVEEVVESSDQRFEDRERIDYKCQYCDQSFITQSKLSLHQNLHRWPKICDYPYCEDKFVMDYELQAHYKAYHESAGKSFHSCQFCDKRYSTEEEMRRHTKLHTDPKICDFPDCGQKFSCQSILKKHQRIHNKSETFECDICHKQFPQSVRLNLHKKVHTNPVVCTHKGCGKEFSSNCYLKMHQLIHCEDKPFGCKWPGCQFVSKYPQSVFAHQSTHTSDRSHKCQWPGCDQTFKTSATLRRHMEYKHKKVHKFVCDWSECGKSFSFKETLKSHHRSHTGERPFACDWPHCQKTFGYRDGLYRHKRRHSGDKEAINDSKAVPKQTAPVVNTSAPLPITTSIELIVPN